MLLGASSVTGVAQGVQIGAKVGGNVANGVGADANKSDIRIGWHAGAMLKANFTKHLGVQTEAQYSLKGDNSVKYGPSILHHLNYLDVPVLLQYTLDDLYLEAGPRYSRLLATSQNVEGVSNLGKEVFNNQVYGLALGFGYQDETGVQVGWRYTADLTNAYRAINFSGDIVQTRLRNSVMQFYLGVLFEPRKLVRATARQQSSGTH